MPYLPAEPGYRARKCSPTANPGAAHLVEIRS
jgi:hypothetical protein